MSHLELCLRASSHCTEWNPLFRNKSSHSVYCAGCQTEKKTENEIKFFSCPCSVFQYCSADCQDAVFRRNNGCHQRDCQMLTRFNSKNMNVQFAGLAMKNEYSLTLFCPTNEKRAHLYEQVLDEYLYRHEQIKAMGMSTDVGVAAHQDFSLIKSRIPFLMAALGHENQAMTELGMTMDFSGRATRLPRTKYDDILQDLLDERQLQYEAWPVCFLLPLFLVKLRLVLEYKTYLMFLNHSTSCFPEDVRMVIADFLIAPQDGDVDDDDEEERDGNKYKTTRQRLLQIYKEQKRQLRTTIELLKQQEEEENKLIDVFDTYGYHQEDMISCTFEADFDGYHDDGLFRFIRTTLQNPPSLKALAKEYITEQASDEPGQDLEWVRNATTPSKVVKRRKIRKEPRDRIFNWVRNETVPSFHMVPMYTISSRYNVM